MPLNIGRTSINASANASLAISLLKTKVLSERLASFDASNTDIGKIVVVSADSSNVHILPLVFKAGDNIKFYNNTSTRITITQNTNVTLYLPNTSNTLGAAATGNRFVASRGFVTLTTVAANTFVVSGIGVS